MFYKLLNVYTRNFSFQHRGLKYFLNVAKLLGIADKAYKKTSQLFLHVIKPNGAYSATALLVWLL